MYVLDTNHIQEIGRETLIGRSLLAELRESGEDAVTTVVCAEEHIRGWFAEIQRCKIPDQARSYNRLRDTIEFYAGWLMLPFDEDAIGIFMRMRTQGVRIGTNDLKIAAITLAHDSTLLTRNMVDFSKVPGLKFANWLD